MSTTRLTAVNTQESIHPASTATTLDTQLLGSPKAPPTAQEIQRKLSVAQRTQKVCVSCYFLNLPRVLCCLYSPRSRCCLSADGITRGTCLWEATQLSSSSRSRSGAQCAVRCSGCRPFHFKSTNEQPSGRHGLPSDATLVHPYLNRVSNSGFIRNVVGTRLPTTWARSSPSPTFYAWRVAVGLCNSRYLDHVFCGWILSRSRLEFVTGPFVCLEFCDCAPMSGSSGIAEFPTTLIAKAVVLFV